MIFYNCSFNYFIIDTQLLINNKKKIVFKFLYNKNIELIYKWLLI